jgi:hypothetical protein
MSTPTNISLSSANALLENFQKLSLPRQQEVLTFVEFLLYVEKEKPRAINDFNQFCDRVGQEAQEQGLTEEKLALLLADE